MSTITGAGSITSSVGRGGINHRPDVETVQRLLNRFVQRLALLPLSPDGYSGPKTEAAIGAFQRQIVGLGLPDCRVDPGGRTIGALNAGATPGAPPPPPNLAVPGDSTVPVRKEIHYKEDIPHDKRLVHSYSFDIIAKALDLANMPAAVITSTLRTPEEQVNLMYKNSLISLAGQYGLYKATGDLVLDVFRDNRHLPEAECKALMVAKIEELATQGRRVSAHVVPLSTYAGLNVIDIGAGSTERACGASFNLDGMTQAFTSLAADGYINRFVDETKISNNCWHVEIIPNVKAL